METIKKYRRREGKIICDLSNDEVNELPATIENEKRVLREMENDYLRSRKDNILDGLKSRKIAKTSSIIAILLFISTILGCSVVAAAHLLFPALLAVENSAVFGALISAAGAIGADLWYEVYYKDYKDKMETAERNDSLLKYQTEINSPKMLEFISDLNPRMAMIINKSKLSNPVNINTISKLSKNEQEKVFSRAEGFALCKEEFFGIEYVDLLDSENEEIIKTAKRRKLIK